MDLIRKTYNFRVERFTEFFSFIMKFKARESTMRYDVIIIEMLNTD